MQEGERPDFQEAVAWLREHARGFSTPEPGGGFEDLLWLRDVFGDTRLVALGEATHGTHEFFAMKHRLLEFLVREMGFTAFVIEASWPEANLINDYVHTGEGDPRSLLKGLGYWTWHTQEVLDLILWVRQYNEGVPQNDEVSFFGFDVQYPGMAIENVLGFLDRVDPGARATAESRYATLKQHLVNPATLPDERSVRVAAVLAANEKYHQLPTSIRQGVRRGLREVYEGLNERRAQYVRATSDRDLERALRSARLVLQGERLVMPPPGRLKQLRLGASFVVRALLRREPRYIDWGGRDKAMAEAAAWLLDQSGPNAKFVLWAHNGPVMTMPGTMGAHLRKRFRDQLLVAAFTFHHGSFRACTLGRTPQEIGPPIPQEAGQLPTNSYENALHAINVPRFIVDLRGQGDVVPAWLWGPRYFRTIGATHSGEQAGMFFRPTRLPREADILIYIDESTPSVYLGADA